jgi:quinol monooxygenase YgiN
MGPLLMKSHLPYIAAVLCSLSVAGILTAQKPAEAPAASQQPARIGDQSFTMLIHFKVKAGKEDAFIAFCRDCIAKTRKETGCFLYHLNQDTKDATKFVLIECWGDKASHEAHMQQAYTKDLLAGFKDYLEPGTSMDNLKPVAEP